MFHAIYKCWLFNVNNVSCVYVADILPIGIKAFFKAGQLKSLQQCLHFECPSTGWPSVLRIERDSERVRESECVCKRERERERERELKSRA